MFDQIYNFITLALMVILKATLFLVLLRFTYRWTQFGRGLLLMFLLFSVAYFMPFLRVAGFDPPDWIAQILRAIAIIDCIVILDALHKYDWPTAPDHVQWRDLLGLKPRGERP